MRLAGQRFTDFGAPTGTKCRVIPVLKLSDNPECLHPAWMDFHRISGQWWLAHTRARAEKALAKELARRELPYFLPMTSQIRFSGGRKRHTMLPLFASYLFFAGDAPQRLTVLSSEHVCQVIEVKNQAQLADELSALHRSIASGAPLHLCEIPRLGTRCQIIRGPLEGIQGIVIREADKTRLVLQVSTIARGAAVEIDADLLEVID